MNCLKTLTLALTCSLFGISAFSQSKYVYEIDLKNVKDDKVLVKLNTPEVQQEKVTFSFPAAIPGSYARKDFGRFIESFTALDKDGNKLVTERLNDNQYRISAAFKLASITYKVNDTWDERHKDFIFQPGGSNIESGKNFVINNNAFFGYIEEYKSLPIEVNVNKPAAMYGATHLEVNRSSAEKDIWYAKNYVYLADNPVIYAKPDTCSFYAGKTKINIFAYSVNGKVSSKQLAGYLKPISQALQNFFNGLPVDSYQFLYFFEDSERALTNHDKGEGGYGALEHNYSSLYYLPEMAIEPKIKQMVYDASMHEFLHILTPLNLHSREIAEFDFINPKMSKHLWLYEGVTEYFSHLLQLQNGLTDEKAFFEEMRNKIIQCEEYGVFSIAEMSANVMEDKWQKKYPSVYNRGALIGFMLDLFIREKTAGSKDLKSVVVALTKKYGPDKPFDDNQFFSDFIEASHPEVKSFINSYIIGSQPLNYNNWFSKVGYTFNALKRSNVFYAGRTPLAFDSGNRTFYFTEVEKNSLNIKDKDILLSVNNEKVTEANAETLLEKYFLRNTDYPEVTVIVQRNGAETTLNSKLNSAYLEIKNYLGPSENTSDTQKSLLKSLAQTKVKALN